MITKKISYQAKEVYLFIDQKRQRRHKSEKKMIALGLDPNQHDIFSRPGY